MVLIILSTPNVKAEEMLSTDISITCEGAQANQLPALSLLAPTKSCCTINPNGRTNNCLLSDGTKDFPLSIVPKEGHLLCSKGDGVMVHMWIRHQSESVKDGVISLSVTLTDGKKRRYPTIGYTRARSDKWTQLSGWYFQAKEGPVAEKLTLIVPKGIKLLIDDISLTYTPKVFPTNDRRCLQVKGQKIMDGAQQIILNGVNVGAYSDDEEDDNLQHVLSAVREDDYRNIATSGFNVVRLNVWHRAFRTEEGWRWLDLHRLWAHTYGLRLILDLHAPPGGYQGPEYRGTFWKENATALQLRKDTITFWKEAAKRLKDASDIAAFDILNEPKPRKDAQWWDFATQCVSAIREEGSNTPIIVEMSMLDNCQLHKIDDTNIIYDVHYYTPWQFTSGKQGTYGTKCIDYYEKGAVLNKEWLLKILKEEVLDFALHHKVPVNIGEYGVTKLALSHGGEQWLSDMVDIFDEYNIGRQYWCWYGYTTWGIEKDGWFRHDPASQDITVLSAIMKRGSEQPSVEK